MPDQMDERPGKQKKSGNKIGLEKVLPFFFIISIVLAFVTGVLWQKVSTLEKASSSFSPTAAPTIANAARGAPSVSANIKDVKIDGEPFVGKEDALVTMAYWRDFQCPFCQRFEQQTLTELYKKYITTGKLRVVFKDLQFLGADSQTVGLAARAVWEIKPDKYYDWQKYVYDHQGQENSGWGTKDKIIDMTKAVLGQEIANKVSSLMDQNKDKYQKAMDDDKAEGAKFGINGTPGFIIENQVVSGAQPLSTFEQIIEGLLNKK